MTLGQHQEAFSRNLVQLMQRAFELGYNVRIGEVLRTAEQQAIYVKTGFSKTSNSMHLKKCAADLHFTDSAGTLVYPDALGKYWESLDPLNQWGGFWKTIVDKPHFQRTV